MRVAAAALASCWRVAPLPACAPPLALLYALGQWAGAGGPAPHRGAAFVGLFCRNGHTRHWNGVRVCDPCPPPLPAHPCPLPAAAAALERIHEKLQKTEPALATARCQGRYSDLALLDAAIADEKSLISKKLTKEEIAAVRQERADLLQMCLFRGPPTAAYLFAPSTTADLAPLKAKYTKESLAGPFEGVKAPSGHH